MSAVLSAIGSSHCFAPEDSKCLAACVLSYGMGVTFASAFFLLAAYQILPPGVNAISNMGVAARAIGYCGLSVGLLSFVLGTIKGRPSEPPQIQSYDIPEGVLFEIFKNLNAKELVKVSRVCKKWYKVASTDNLWRGRILQDYMSFQVMPNTVIEHTGCKKLYFSSSAKAFKKMNHTHTFYHGSPVSHAELFKDSNGVIKLISIALDGTLKIWDITNQKPILELDYKQALKHETRASEFKSYRLHSVSNEGCGIYDQETKKGIVSIKWQLEEHTFSFDEDVSEEINIENYEDKFTCRNLISGELEIFIFKYKRIVIRNYSRDKFTTLYLVGNTFITSDMAGHIRFWDVNKPKKCFKDIDLSHLLAVDNGILKLTMKYSFLICGCKNGRVHLIKEDRLNFLQC